MPQGCPTSCGANGRHIGRTSDIAKSMLTSRKLILVIVVSGLALRIAAALLLPDQSAQWDDARAYRLIGHDFWTTGRFKSLLYKPLYPLIAGVTEAHWPSLVL